MTVRSTQLIDLEPQLRRRTRIVALLVAVGLTVCLVGVLGRVAALRWLPDKPLLDQAAHRYSTTILYGRRGSITDRHGRLIAVTRLGYQLFVDPAMIDDFSEFSARLAHAIGDDPARIDQLIGTHADKRYVVIDKLLTDTQANRVRQLHLPGAALANRPVRRYAAGNLAGQVVGFVGDEHIGLDGVEFVFDEHLRSRNGRLRYLRDARRRALWVNEQDYQPPRHGQDLRLSIDLVIQEIAQQELLATVERYRPKSAELIVMNARDGQLLAMANWPFYDPNERGNAPPARRRNRCVTDPYEPGSIFKPYVHAAVSAAGLARPDQIIDTSTTGSWRTDFGRTLHDASAHGALTWDMVLVKSSNIGMAKMGLKLGVRRMYDAVRRFGFGSVTGCGLAGESPGIVNPRSRWNRYSITSVPMGQEISVTPLQVVRAFSAFANGGRMVRPSILADAADRPHFQQAIDPAIADHTRSVLRRVVTEGTGRKANSARYQLFGKTGTAQVPAPDRRGYLPHAYTGSFVCGAPYHNPRIIVAVVVHQPDPARGYYGGIVAGPVARHVVERTLAYLGIPPDVEPAVKAPRVAER